MVLYILLAIVILLCMVVIHEFGHYVVGKIFGFKINEFAVGFGPKLISKKRKNGEVVSLRAIPLGGFCAFEGEDENGKIPEKSFYNEKPYKRILVLLGGGAFNLLSAVVFSFIFIIVVGTALPQVGAVSYSPDGTAYNTLQSGDIITAVDGNDITIMTDFTTLVADIEEGTSVSLTVVRNGVEVPISVLKQVITTDEGETYVGFGFTNGVYYESANFLYSLKYCVPFTGKMALTILQSLGSIITGAIGLNDMTGPVGTIVVIADLSAMSIANVLLLLPLLASNLGIFNLLPIPALDGSKIIFTTIEWIRKKPINRNVESVIHLVGMVALFSFVIMLDILSFL